MVTATESPAPGNFIRDIIDRDRAAGAYGGRVVTRFPPEPNGFLHIGHAKSICLNFGIARDYGGDCHLRFDDTNPTTEDLRYVEAIQEDVRWLGFDWGDKLFFASDYFEQLYRYAERLVRAGKAYVCSLSEPEIRSFRGSLTQPGRPSPYRERPVEENLELLAEMRAGVHPDGSHVLRARIDMAAANMKMRDPLLYRIRHAHHYRTGDAWCIYPMYDFAHPLSDAIERVTHSICTLEFENNRELYDWLLAACDITEPPKQIEFARLNLDYTVMSKRKLLRLVNERRVDGWNDPRMPTLAGMRRRGVTPEAIRSFCELIGVAKANSTVDIGKLEYAIRDDLNFRAPRVMCVLRPLRVTLDNFPEDRVESLDAPCFPADVGKAGSRPLQFDRELLIERDDFSEDPPPDFHRLAPGRAVRLRHAYSIRCDQVIKDPATGEPVELRCSYLPDTLGQPTGRKGGGVIHWVSARHSVPATVHLYDRLCRSARPDADGDFLEALNPDSLEILRNCRVESSVAGAAPGSHLQFERVGYFYLSGWSDRAGAGAAAPAPSAGAELVFNRIIGLRDTRPAGSDTGRPTSVAPGTSTSPAAGERPAPGNQTGAATAPAPPRRQRPAKRSRAELRERARERNPALAARMQRYQSLGLGRDDADVLSGEPELGDFYEAALAVHQSPQSVANWLVNVALPAVKELSIAGLRFGPAEFARLVALVDAGTLSVPQAKEVLAQMSAQGGEPEQIARERKLDQVTDAAALTALVDQVLAAHPDKVASYRAGKTGLLGFFVGQVMKSSAGNANPQTVQELLARKLS